MYSTLPTLETDRYCAQAPEQLLAQSVHGVQHPPGVAAHAVGIAVGYAGWLPAPGRIDEARNAAR